MCKIQTAWIATAVVGSAIGAGVVGCAGSRLPGQTASELRRAVVESARRAMELEAAEAAETTHTLERPPSQMPVPASRVAELDAISGPVSLWQTEVPLGNDLLGMPTSTMPIEMDEAIASALEHNLAIASAQIGPAIGNAQRVAAEAVFDWTLFADARFTQTDEQSAIPLVGGVPVGSSVNKNQAYSFGTGVRKRTSLGGAIELSQRLDVYNNQSQNFSRDPDPSRIANLDAILTQPLLRGFGHDVNCANVRLAQNIERRAFEVLRGELIDTLTEVQVAYWSLRAAHEVLRARQRTLIRGEATREMLGNRADFDARPSELADATAQVETRRADVIRSASEVRMRSDELKALLRDPRFPLAGELLLVPTTKPPRAPVSYNLLESFARGARLRPDLRLAAIAIDDTIVQQRVAENTALPLLDAQIGATLFGLEQDAGDAYSEAFESEFVDYFVAMRFEHPIGNRAAEANLTGSRLSRIRAAMEYRQRAQDVVLGIKSALRELATAYQLIEQTRIARLAAAENLRTLLVEEETTRGTTPAFLDLKLRRQQSLAEAEMQESRAATNYAVGIASLHRAVGDTLERLGVEIVVPNADELLSNTP